MTAKGDYQAAMNIASGISDTTMRTNAQSSVAFSSVTFFEDSSWTRTDPQGALAWANQQTDPELKGKILQRVLPIMAETDLQGALAWANQQTDPELKGRILEGVLPVMAKSDLQGALAWANQQTDPELKGRILQGMLPIMAKSDLQGALAAAQSFNNSERLISEVFSNAASNNPQGALNMMQSLPAGRAKDAASGAISMGMAEKGDYQAAMNIASGISDIKTRTDAQAEVFVIYFRKDRAAATQWLQSLPAGQAKDVFSDRIIFYANTLVGMNIASGIGDTSMRTEAQAKVARKWLEIDRVGATQWINSSSLPQDVKNGLLQQE